MNNLWEQSNIQANCDICGVDSPFYMPVNRTDMVALRFQVPYHLVASNGGALPIGTNVRLSMIDETGTTPLCDLGNATGGKFMFARYLDATNKVAQYQFYFPVPFKDELGFNYRHAYLDVNEGQYVEISGANTEADGGFTYGVDETPAIFQEIKAGRLVFPFRMPGLTLSVSLDGTPITIGYPYSGPTCDHEDFDCWRVKLEVVFSVASVTKTYYTKPFRVNRTCDDSVRVDGIYPPLSTDCNGYVHDGVMSPNIADLNRLFLRIPAVLNQAPSKVRKTYNDKCFSIRGERQQAYRLNSEPMPQWFVSEAEGVALAKDFFVDNLALQLPDGDTLFVGVDIPGYVYQYLDVPLTSCKCFLIYSC